MVQAVEFLERRPGARAVTYSDKYVGLNSCASAVLDSLLTQPLPNWNFRQKVEAIYRLAKSSLTQ